MDGLNLLTEPWLPVRTLDGRNLELSLTQLFSEADQLGDLLAESRERHALYLLLIAIGWEAAKGWQSRTAPVSKDELLTWAAAPETIKHFGSHLDFLADDLDGLIARHKLPSDSKEFLPLERAWLNRFPCGEGVVIYNRDGLGSQAEHFRQRIALLAWMPGHAGNSRAPRYGQAINVLLRGRTILDTIQIAVGQLVAKARNNSAEFVQKIIGRAGWINPEGRNSTVVGRLTAQPMLLQPVPDGWHYVKLANGPVKTALYKPWPAGFDSSFSDFDQRSELDEKSKSFRAIKWKNNSIGWDFIPALLADESLTSNAITSIRIVTTSCNSANTREVIEAEYPLQEFFSDSLVMQETAARVKALADAIRERSKYKTPERKWKLESEQRWGRKQAASRQLLSDARTDYRMLLQPEASKRQSHLYRIAKGALDTHCPSLTVVDAKDYTRLLTAFRKLIWQHK